MGGVTRFKRARNGPFRKGPRRPRARLPQLLGFAIVVGIAVGVLMFELASAPYGARAELAAWWRALGDVAARATGLGGCNIKGNISAGGERIYHLPDDRYYGVTRIDLLKGERYFCSESEARAAGWRHARM